FPRLALLGVEQLEPRELLSGGTVLANQASYLSLGNQQVAVTATVTANDSNYQGLYLWQYHVQNVNFNPGGEGVGILNLFFSPTTDVANLTGPAGWTEGFGTVGGGSGVSFVASEQSGSVLQPGQSADFSFTTLPRALALDGATAW